MKTKMDFSIIGTLIGLVLFTGLTLSSCKKEKPEADFSFSGAGDHAPCTVTFTNTSKNAENFEWNFGDGATSTEKNPVHTYTTGGTFTVKLTASNSDGSSEITKNITILEPVELPTANFSFSGAGGVAPCTVSFTNESTNADSYSWDFGDGHTSTETNPTHTYQSGGTFTVTLTATNQYGSNSITKNVNIQSPEGPTANFTFSGAGGMAPCTVTFHNTSTNASSYSWDFGDGSTSTQTNPSHTYESGGTFTVTLTATNQYGSNSITKNVNIQDPPNRITIDGLEITYFPQTESDGGNWDYSNGPDIYWKLLDENENQIYESGYADNATQSDLPIYYSADIDIDDLSQMYDFQFYDYDPSSSDDFMDFYFVIFSDYDDYPEIIHIQRYDEYFIDFDIYVSWYNSKGEKIKTGKELTLIIKDKKVVKKILK